MPKIQRTETVLRTIRVVSRGKRDVVYLKYNNLRIFALTCEAAKPSRFHVSKKFLTYDLDTWNKVFGEYSQWKRVTMPEFKLPNYSGRMKSGQSHPWSYQKQSLAAKHRSGSH